MATHQPHQWILADIVTLRTQSKACQSSDRDSSQMQARHLTKSRPYLTPTRMLVLTITSNKCLKTVFMQIKKL